LPAAAGLLDAPPPAAEEPPDELGVLLARPLQLSLRDGSIGGVLHHRRHPDHSSVFVGQRGIEPLANDLAPVFGQVLVDRMGAHVSAPNAVEDLLSERLLLSVRDIDHCASMVDNAVCRRCGAFRDQSKVLFSPL